MAPHPIVVDFAVALLLTSVACDLLSAVVEEPELETVAWWTLIFGTLAAAFAALSGYAAASYATGLVADSPPDGWTETRPLVEWHRYLGLATLATFAVMLVWRGYHDTRIPETPRNLYWLLATTGAILMCLTAYFGGTLVFAHAVGVTPPA